MKRAKTRIALVLESPALRPYLRTALEGYTVRRVAGWDALHAALRDTSSATTIVADPYEGASDDGAAPDPRLRRLLREFPSVPVVAALHLGRAPAEHVRAVLDWGASEVLDLRLDRNPGALAYRLRAAHARPLKRRIEAGLSRTVSMRAVVLLRAAAAVATDGGDRPELAAVFGVELKTLAEWCRREALPQPGRLLAWARVLLAATLLEDAARTVRGAAAACGYASPFALRRALRKLLGGAALPPRDRLRAGHARLQRRDAGAARGPPRAPSRRRRPAGGPGADLTPAPRRG